MKPSLRDIKTGYKKNWWWWGAGTGCPDMWWMPHLWRHSRSNWMGLWATWSSCRCPCSLQRSWTRWLLRVSSNSSDSMIVWNLTARNTVCACTDKESKWNIWESNVSIPGVTHENHIYECRGGLSTPPMDGVHIYVCQVSEEQVLWAAEGTGIVQSEEEEARGRPYRSLQLC